MKSKLQEMSDIIREASEEKEKLRTDHTKILSRIEKVNKDIQTLQDIRKELYFELSCSDAVLMSKEQQIQSAKNMVIEIVRPSFHMYDETGAGKDLKAEGVF